MIETRENETFYVDLDLKVWKKDEEHQPIHFAPSVDSGPKNAKTFLSDSPMQLLFTGKLLNEVPTILGVNAHEALYRSLRKYAACYKRELR